MMEDFSDVKPGIMELIQEEQRVRTYKVHTPYVQFLKLGRLAAPSLVLRIRPLNNSLRS